MKKKLLIVLIVLLFAGCSLKDITQQDHSENEDLQMEQTGKTTNDKPEVLLSGLDAPWSIQEVEETLFVSERTGSIVQLKDGKVKREPVELKEELSEESEAGLLGFLLAPGFEDSGQGFAYYTYESGGVPVNRVVTLQYEEGIWKETEVLLDQIPSGNYHHGGRIKIGFDNKLYVTTGDAKQGEIAQDVNSLGGKILRMNLDGSIPDDNPFPNSYVYSYGHRNPQGLTWDLEGRLYSSEHGESGKDELNHIEPGKNYGWPEIEGDEKKAGMETPLIHAGDNTWAPSGIAYNNGKIYIASLRGEALKAYDIVTKNMKDIVTDQGRIRDVYIDGTYLYFISNNTDGRGNPDKKDDRLYRIPLSTLK